MKFGKVPIELLQMTICELDSSADAVVIGDFNNYTLDVLPSRGLAKSIEVYRRIKILNQDGIDKMSDFKIYLYDRNSSHDKIVQFKACTYNLEEGNIVETKLERDSRFIEENDGYNIYNFAFTNVRVGSVLEYKFTVHSDHYSYFPTYYPQSEVPVLWSELEMKYYEEIEFKYFVQGAVPVTYFDGDFIDGKYVDTWVFKNVPSVEQDVFMGPVENYQTQINYELRKIAIPGVYYKDYTTSWSGVSRYLMDHDHFGHLLNKERFFEDIVDYVMLDAKATDELTKVQSAIGYIRGNYKWNGSNRFFPTWEFKDVVDDKKGNSADMNFLLIGALKALGITSRPVVLSTHDNGILLRSKASTDDLNYTIASFDIRDSRYLIDLATYYSGINSLPSKCLNGEGFVLDMNYPKWINLDTDLKFSRRVYVQAEITDDLLLEGVCQTKEMGYAAQDLRRDVSREGSLEEYVDQKQKDAVDIAYSDYEMKNLDIIGSDINQKFNFSIEHKLEEMGDYFTFQPILFKDVDDNPFTKEKRDFNIDFLYPRAIDYTYIYTIPEGFAIEELPKPTRVQNEEKTISFLLNSVAQGNKVTVTLKFKIDQKIYFASKYGEIKSFFDYFIENQQQLIILKQL